MSEENGSKQKYLITGISQFTNRLRISIIIKSGDTQYILFICIKAGVCCAEESSCDGEMAVYTQEW